jgi:hypothetical protein
MRGAVALDQLRVEMSPQADDPEHDLRQLICYHLLTAAANCRRVGEARAARDRTAAAKAKP